MKEAEEHDEGDETEEDDEAIGLGINSIENFCLEFSQERPLEILF